MSTIVWNWQQATDHFEDRFSDDVQLIHLCSGNSRPVKELEPGTLCQLVVGNFDDSHILGQLTGPAAVLGCAQEIVHSITLLRPREAASLRQVFMSMPMDAACDWRADTSRSSEKRPLAADGGHFWTPWRDVLLKSLWEQQLEVPSLRRTEIEAAARLLQNDLDGSHLCSQRIEGQGHFRTGDYLHAIMHRREPDYSNSIYWFRRVGEHPLFPRLAVEWRKIAGDNQDWPKLNEAAQNGRWDAAAFVDACEKCERETSSRAEPLKEMQHRELLLLWHWLWKAI